MSQGKKLETALDNASSLSFFLAIIASRLYYLPFAIFAGISYVVSLFLYLIGYLLWAISSHFYPDHPRLKGHWCGFVQFREQSKMSAAIGTIAVILSFVAFVMPILIIPSLWLFFASNLIWSVSHYHRLKNPPTNEPNYSTESQTSYLNYTILTTVLSVVTAVCLTAAILSPVSAPLLLTVSACFGITLTVAAMGYFFHYHLAGYLSKCWNGRNYSQISANLDPNDPQKGLTTASTPEPTELEENQEHREHQEYQDHQQAPQQPTVSQGATVVSSDPSVSAEYPRPQAPITDEKRENPEKPKKIVIKSPKEEKFQLMPAKSKEAPKEEIDYKIPEEVDKTPTEVYTPPSQ
jgi:hypothetical protein